MTFLLDVNALLALRYAAHVHHERVHQWVSRLPAENGRDCAIFATCRITELGFVRVGSGKAGYATNLDSARADPSTDGFKTFDISLTSRRGNNLRNLREQRARVRECSIMPCTQARSQ